VIGQDPAAEEDVTRRILVGVAGQRTQGYMARVGITSSYVMINTFLYSVASQTGGAHHEKDAAIVAYRNRWLDTLFAHNQFQAVATLGTLAADAWTTWIATPTGQPHHALEHAALLHPTYPESASATGQISLADATKKLLDNWNQNMPALIAAITHPDEPASGTPYGDTFKPTDLAQIPEADLPPGLPDWMRSNEVWAHRTGATPDDKRATLTAAVPTDLRVWVNP
jgi:hypothetical protein